MLGGRMISRFLSCILRSPQRKSSTLAPLEVLESNGVRRIVLSDLNTKNSLSLNMVSHLKNAVKNNENDPQLRCIVISAKGSVFSSGFNLKELADPSCRKVFDDYNELMMSMINSPVPVIAAIDGLAAAAGCQLVAQSDIALCTTTSKFSTPGASFGIFCSSPGVPLVRSIGRKMALHMLLTGYTISADQALNAGLVSHVSPPDGLENLVSETTAGIMSKGRAVIELGKKFFYQQVEMDIAKAYQKSSDIMKKNLEMEDGIEGMESFIKKRKPVWK